MEAYDMELVLATPNPAEVISYIEGRKVNGLYFLDVELESTSRGLINGVELARAIRQHDPRGFIAFVTAHPQYMQITFEYQVEAMAYIQKTGDEQLVRQKITECIKNAYSKHTSRADEGRFIFKSTNGRMVALPYSQILFIETQKGSKRLILHTKKRQYTFYATINDLTKKLPKGHFYKCHKSTILNVNNLSPENKQELITKKDHITMPDGTQCNIATRKRKELLNMIPSFRSKD